MLCGALIPPGGRYEYLEEVIYNARRAKLRALERCGALFLDPEAPAHNHTHP